MARRRQKKSFKQRVKQLVAEGEVKSAYGILVSNEWIPRGSGYQEHYPTGLRFYAKVDDERQILVSKSGRYWAWDFPGDQKETREAYLEKFRTRELPEIAREIRGLSGVAFMLEHDAADGRIGGDIDSSLQSITKHVSLLSEAFADKAGIDLEDRDAVSRRLREENAKYEKMMTERWQQIFQVGAVLRLVGGHGLVEDIDSLFEVIGLYCSNWFLEDQLVLVRKRGTGAIDEFRESDVDNLLPVEAEPIYLDDPSFLRRQGGGEFPRDQRRGEDIRGRCEVFYYQGEEDDPRNGLWETHDVYFIPGKEGEEVVIARCHDRPQIAEFTAGDLTRINLSFALPKFIKYGPTGSSIPPLEIGGEEVTSAPMGED
ncbi:MAG: hypothetical protein MUP45_00745 [Candidatus Marinimicrobia bacterium]|nr:hypothetical protein [Candidatus Neomarinimicrobiota bacterium]